jgi:hypothetical protein
MVIPAVVKKPKVKKPARVNHRKEKYLKRQVKRLRTHNHLINAKRRHREQKNKLENIIIETLEMSNNGVH